MPKEKEDIKQPQDRKRKEKKPTFKTAYILMDPALGDELDALIARRTDLQAKVVRSPNNEELQARLRAVQSEVEELEQRVEEETEPYVFRSIGRPKMEKLLEDNPPTAEQIAEAKKEGINEVSFNPETYPSALIAEASYDPVMDLEEVQDMWDSPDWNTSEILELFTAAQEAQISYRKASNLKKGFKGTRT
jgi:hypothetical protein